MPLIFFGSNGIGLTSKLFGLTAGAAGAAVSAAASAGHIAAVTAAPAVNAELACTKLRRSNSVVIVSVHTDVASVYTRWHPSHPSEGGRHGTGRNAQIAA